MSLVTVETRDDIAILTLDRPKANAFSPELVAELVVVARRRRTNGRGDRSHFGAARHLLGRLGPAAPRRRRPQGHGTASSGTTATSCARSSRLGPPVVAALPGHAIAGGLIVAMAADERIAAAGKGRSSASRRSFSACRFPQCLMEPFRHVIGARHMERLAATGENVGVEQALGDRPPRPRRRPPRSSSTAPSSARGFWPGSRAPPTRRSSGARARPRSRASTRPATTIRSSTSGSRRTRASGSATWWRG